MKDRPSVGSSCSSDNIVCSTRVERSAQKNRCKPNIEIIRMSVGTRVHQGVKRRCELRIGRLRVIVLLVEPFFVKQELERLLVFAGKVFPPSSSLATAHQ